jgi:predicted nucleic acid-binding protein
MGTLGVVLDTNVLVSALGFGGPPLDVLLRTFDDEVRLLASVATLDDLEDDRLVEVVERDEGTAARLRT